MNLIFSDVYQLTGSDKKYAEKCYEILDFYLIETKFDTYKLY